MVAQATTAAAVKQKLLFAQMRHSTRLVDHNQGKLTKIRQHIVTIDAWDGKAPKLQEEEVQQLINDLVLPYLTLKFPSLDKAAIINISWTFSVKKHYWKYKVLKVTVKRRITKEERAALIKRKAAQKTLENKRRAASTATDSYGVAENLASICIKINDVMYHHKRIYKNFDRVTLSASKLEELENNIKAVEDHLKLYR